MLKAKVLILKRSSGEGKSARIANTGNLSSASSSVRNESKMREKGKSGCLRKVAGAGIPGMVVKGEAGSGACERCSACHFELGAQLQELRILGLLKCLALMGVACGRPGSSSRGNRRDEKSERSSRRGSGGRGRSASSSSRSRSRSPPRSPRRR